jgi:uncharacterized membrane protein
MHHLVYSTWGLAHLLAAVLSLLLGTAVLALPKPGKLHRRLGYGYVGSLAVMLSTSFAIYRQYYGLGIFHFAALLSAATLLAGMVPLWRRQPGRHWLHWHYGFMYLSVLELYVALVAEGLVRVPGLAFWEVAGASLAVVLLPGAALFGRLRRQWRALSAPPELSAARGHEAAGTRLRLAKTRVIGLGSRRLPV